MLIVYSMQLDTGAKYVGINPGIFLVFLSLSCILVPMTNFFCIPMPNL